MSASGIHSERGHLLMGEVDHVAMAVRQAGGCFVPAGGLTYHRLRADCRSRMAAAEAKLDERVTSFASLLAPIGPPNANLVAEWNATVGMHNRAEVPPPIAPPLHSLALPRVHSRTSIGCSAALNLNVGASDGSGGYGASGSSSSSSGTHGTRGASRDASSDVVALCSGHEASRWLWLRWLDATDLASTAHTRRGEWARLLPAVRFARRCADGGVDGVSAVELLRSHLACFADTSIAGMSTLDATALRACRSLLAAIAASTATSAPTAEMEATEAALCAALGAGLAAFRRSPHGKMALRLSHAVPQRVSLNSFTLLRRYGRGSYGEVFAARKEDTLALFALKFVHAKRIQSRGAAQHLAMERRVAERLGGSSFLCGLRYAFHHGASWYVLVFPLLPGGTLQVHLDERTSAGAGLPLVEVKWIGAQLVLALTHLHDLQLLHRDIKPSNLMQRHSGYLVLCDFGLTADLAVDTPTSRTGTRGFWAPGTCVTPTQGAPCKPPAPARLPFLSR